MRAKLAAVVAWVPSVTTLSVGVGWLVDHFPAAVALAQVVGLPFPDPPLGSHCSCERGLCPLDSNGRRCSCGCAKRADAQPLQKLDSVAGVTCTDGMAGGHTPRDDDPHG